MRILMLSQFYPPVIGGEERHVITLSEALVDRGHEVSVASLIHPDRDEVTESHGVTVRGIKSTMQRCAALFTEPERQHAPPFPDPELVYKLSKIVRLTKPDVVHGHNWLARSFLPLKRFARAGFVVTLHDYSLPCAKKNMLHKGASCTGPGVAKCLQCASDHYGPTVGRVTCATNWASSVIERRTVDKYLAVSKAVAKQCNLIDGTIPYEVLPTFISDGIGTLSSSPDARVQELPPNGYLLFVGDITGGKGVDVLLKAYAQLVDAPPLVLIGRRCADTPRELPANVTLFESWPHDAVMHAWSKCLFGIAPSVFPEACGTIVMEANAVGKTMVASRIGGLSDLIDAGKTGLLVPPNDVDALANAMQFLVENPEQRESMAAASRKYVERFMAKSIVPRIERVYQEISAGAAPRGHEVSGATLARGQGL
jgi:glycosyltransferase involved in cell wall biosynthesis